MIGWRIENLIRMILERDNLDANDPLFSARLSQAQANISLCIAELDEDLVRTIRLHVAAKEAQKQ